MLIGITGGIGSGKSSLARLFARWGAVVVDADQLAHQVLEDQEIKAQLQSAFGAEVVDAEGRLNRSAVGRVAFASRQNWERLNQIVRPQLEVALWAAVEEAIRTAGCQGIVVVDAPLLFEWKIENRFDVVIVVEANDDQCVARVRQRSQLSEEEIRRRMAFQMSPEEKRARADCIVDNRGDQQELERQAKKLWEEMAASC